MSEGNHQKLPRLVWMLGLVSLCMDLSSEMIHALLPVFLVSTLQSGPLAVGIIEGIAEGTASITKIFSGVLSDWFGRRKPLVVLGYGLAALTKPLFPIANSASWVLLARFADRIGKGIRGAPRDALLADATVPEQRGAAFGLRQALDTLGALLGPLVALWLMSVFASNIRAVFWVATIPAIIAVLALVFAVEEPTQHTTNKARALLPSWSSARTLGSPFWMAVFVGAVFTLARFSEAFLIVRAYDVGLSLNWTPLALAVMNVTYVASAYPAGRLSDRIGRHALLVVGTFVLVAADAVLIAGSSVTAVLIGTAIWGLHLGLTQGILAAWVADSAPAELRGTAFGIFYFVSGVTAIVSNLLAGALWTWRGPAFTFGVGAVFAVLGAVSLLGVRARP
jgi:MFS family permease